MLMGDQQLEVECKWQTQITMFFTTDTLRISHLLPPNMKIDRRELANQLAKLIWETEMNHMQLLAKKSEK